MDEATQHDTDLIGLAADIVGAYVTRNNVPASELPNLIAATHAALVQLNAPPASAVEDHKLTGGQIRESITPDYITSFLDGRPYKSLKRHLNAQGYTLDEYHQKFGRSHDYPMVAANYAAQRSELAKSLGLGQRRREQAAARKAAAEVPAGEPAAPARPGRPKKVEAAAE